MIGGPSFLRKEARIHDAPAPKDVPVLSQNIGQFTRGEPWRLGLVHDRPADLLIWITRGQGKALIDGVRRGLGAHNALFLPAGTLFSVSLGPQTLAQVVQAPSGTFTKPGSGGRLLRVRDGLVQAELTGLVDALSREISQNRPHLKDAIEAHLKLMSVWLRRHEEETDRPRESASDRLARRFADLLVAEHRSAMNMADYAKRLDVTPTHLARVCRSASGVTAADLLTERKVHAARCALADTEKPIQKIAEGLGFGSPAYFTRFMQNQTGHTPSALRQRSKRT